MSRKIKNIFRFISFCALENCYFYHNRIYIENIKCVSRSKKVYEILRKKNKVYIFVPVSCNGHIFFREEASPMHSVLLFSIVNSKSKRKYL